MADEVQNIAHTEPQYDSITVAENEVWYSVISVILFTWKNKNETFKWFQAGTPDIPKAAVHYKMNLFFNSR